MTLTGFETATSLLVHLAEPAARAVALALFVAVGLTTFRVKATSLHLGAWTGVLYIALAMPLLGWMLPSLAIPTPAFLHFSSAPTPESVLDLSSADQNSAPASVEVPKAAAHVNVNHDRAARRTVAVQPNSDSAVSGQSAVEISVDRKSVV